MKLERTWMGLGAAASWLVLGCAAVGCSSDADTVAATGDEPVPVTDLIDVQVDTNRDGFVNDLDNEGEDVWDAAHGAAFLANLDDDNLDGIRDADDAVVNIDAMNQADRYDLATILLKASPDAPDGATAWLTIDALSMKHVRVFLKDATGAFTLVLGSDGPCGAGGDGTCPFWNHALELSVEQLRAGSELIIEGRRLVGLPDSTSVDPVTMQASDWTGLVTLEYAVLKDGKPHTTAESPEGIDRAVLRVAPWLMFGNSTPKFDTIFANTPSPIFVQGIEAATTAAGVNFWKVTNWQDHWTEDYFQTGFASMPWADGQVAGMRLAMPRPWGRSNTEASLPVNWLKESHLFGDSGYFVVYKKSFTGSTFDSHGNHDLFPPYAIDGGQSYPFGRIIHGSNILPETKKFYDAQLVQGPSLVVKTDWLIVGHVDEAFSYLPANNARGWKLMVGSPRLAKTMLEGWQKAGAGSALMFEGKKWSNGKLAQLSIDEVLADADIMQWSQDAQASIDAMVVTVKAEAGITDEEIVEIPYLFEAENYPGEGWLNVALNPGTVNMRYFNGYAVIPDPFGPKIDGEDGFKKDLNDRLGTGVSGLGADGKGIKVFYADDWDMYHRLLGEVHCGSNFEGVPQPEMTWWKAMQ
ncbi:MAG: hypothetical protein EXR75_10570 [Myxococcales bacterium]|nr:hypothetical protein [Myxococcales bacterium]